MQFLVKYIIDYKNFICLIFICLCISISVNAQHKKSSKKKTSHQSASHKTSSAHHESNSHSKKSKHSESHSKKSKHSESHSKKSKHSESGHSKKSRHQSSRDKKHGKKHSRHGHVYVDNDERDYEEVAAPVATEPVNDNSTLRVAFQHPAETAKPWVQWYWMEAAISREGITADLQAMKDAGIGGVYVVSVKATANPPLMSPAIEQATPQWLDMVRFAAAEAQRLGIQFNADPKANYQKAFTGTINNWNTSPAGLKAICDSDLATGNNHLVLNAFIHNPWPERKPGMAADSAGVYLQQNQTWWKQGYAWIQYLQRCEALLQIGNPVANIANDLTATDSLSQPVKDIVWTHRSDVDYDTYFIANQQGTQRDVSLSLAVANKIPEMWDPMTGETYQCSEFNSDNDRTNLTLRLEPNGSFFIVLRKPAHTGARRGKNWSDFKTVRSVDGVWEVNFDPKFGGPDGQVVFTTLISWTKNEIPGIKYYSGTADYLQVVKWNNNLTSHKQVWLDLGNVANAATVTINGVVCGTAWTPPYRVDITKALRTGYNKVHVEVSNTWNNRLIRDHSLADGKRLTWTNQLYNLDDKALLPAGLLGPVKIITVDRSKRD